MTASSGVFVLFLKIRPHILFSPMLMYSSHTHKAASKFEKFLLALRLAVTLTFDPLILNFCGRPGIMWSMYVQTFI